MRWIDAALNALLPPAHCLACGDPRRLDAGAALCDACRNALAEQKLLYHVCPQCLSPRPGNTPCAYCLEGGMAGLAAAYAPFHYHGVVQRLVTQLKFGAVEDAALPLAQAMAACVSAQGFDAAVPVPLSKARLSERGFNQALILAELVAKANGYTVRQALARRRDTRRQSSLASDAKRRANVENAFEAVLPVRGFKLLLVDDVRTTGATARACAAALLSAGAGEVHLLTAAVAPPRARKEPHHA